LFKKKREFADFADAIKKGAAEGIIVASSKLFQMVKGGNLGAVIFYLKSRAGWREHSDGANANIKLNISGRGERMEEEIEAERQEQMKMVRLLTVEERRIYLDLMERAAERLKRAKGPLIEIRAGTALDDAADGRNGDG
jgi:hypothetical protein